MSKLTKTIKVVFTEIDGKNWVSSDDYDKLYDFALELEENNRALRERVAAE